MTKESMPSNHASASRSLDYPASRERARSHSASNDNRSASIPVLDDQSSYTGNRNMPAPHDDRGAFPGHNDRAAKEAQERAHHAMISGDVSPIGDDDDDENNDPNFPSDRASKALRQRQIKAKAAAAALATMSSTQAKMIQALLATVCLWKLYEMNQMKSTSMGALVSQLFHGFQAKKIVGQIEQFENGSGFYEPVWSNDNGSPKISSEFSCVLSNLPKRSLTHKGKQLLGLSNFGKNPQILTGKSILNKGNKTLKECKKFQAFWDEFLVNGNFPSGKDETDCLKLCCWLDQDVS
jgi:hypothetical protein